MLQLEKKQNAYYLGGKWVLYIYIIINFRIALLIINITKSLLTSWIQVHCSFCRTKILILSPVLLFSPSSKNELKTAPWIDVSRYYGTKSTSHLCLQSLLASIKRMIRSIGFCRHLISQVLSKSRTPGSYATETELIPIWYLKKSIAIFRIAFIYFVQCFSSSFFA